MNVLRAPGKCSPSLQFIQGVKLPPRRSGLVSHGPVHGDAN